MQSPLQRPLWQVYLIFLAPMVLSNFLQSLSGTLNGIYVGQMLGTQALAAVSGMVPVVFFFIALVIGLGAGASVLIGQAWGAQETAMVKSITGATLALGALVPSAVNLISEFAPQGRRSTMITEMSSFYSVGAVLSALLAIAVIPQWGWQAVFYVAVLPVLAVPFMLRYLPESAAFLELKGRRAELERLLAKVDPAFRPGTELHLAGSDQPVDKARLAQLFGPGQALATLLLWVAFAMCMLMSYGLNTWLPKLMAQGGYPLGSSLAFLVTLNIGATVGALFGGWLADRLGVQRTLALFFVLAALSLAALGLNPGPLLLNLLLLVAGATTIGTLAVIHAYASIAYPAHIRSTGVGWAAGIGRLGAIAGPMLGGSLLSMQLPIQQNFFAFALPGVIGALAIAFIQVRAPQQASEPEAANKPTC